MRVLPCIPGSALLTISLEPAKYDFADTRAIAVYDDDASTAETASDQDESGSGSAVEKSPPGDKEATKGAISAEVVVVKTGNDEALDASHAELESVFKRAAWYSLALTVAVAILGELVRTHQCDSGAEQYWQSRFRCFSLTMCSARDFIRSGWRALCEYACSTLNHANPSRPQNLGCHERDMVHGPASVGVQSRDHDHRARRSRTQVDGPSEITLTVGESTDSNRTTNTHDRYTLSSGLT